MKRIIALFTLMLLALVPVVAQTADLSAATGIDPNYFTSFAGLAAAIIPVTSIINRIFDVGNDYKQLISWLVAVLLGIIPYYLELGIFAGVDWYVALLYSLGAGLVSNGLFDIELVKDILKKIGLEPKDKKSPIL